MPQVTVVVPIYNSAKTIKRAIDSIVAQTFSDLEIVVVDDGSTDQGSDVVAQYGISNLNLIKHLHNKGAAAARNTGVVAARGRLIAFLDSDDVWRRDKVERQVAAINLAGDSISRACATGYIFHKRNRTLTVNLDMPAVQFRRDILFGCTISPGTTLLVDRRVFDEVGYFDEDLRRLEDWDWLLRFARWDGGEMLTLSEPLADIYEDPQGPERSKKTLDEVMHALTRIAEKQLPAFKGLARRKLRSALYVETAANLYRSGRPFSAAGYVLAGLVIYPHRNAAFFRTLWRSVRTLFWMR